MHPAAATPTTRLRRAITAAAGLLIVIGASVVGLHDVADAHLADGASSTQR